MASGGTLEIWRGNAQLGGANVVGYLKHCPLESGPNQQGRSVGALAISRNVNGQHPQNGRTDRLLP